MSFGILALSKTGPFGGYAAILLRCCPLKVAKHQAGRNSAERQVEPFPSEQGMQDACMRLKGFSERRRSKWD
jgi:hypothetical protein